MRIRSKIASTLLAGALGMPLAFAQGAAQEPGLAPDQGSGQNGPSGAPTGPPPGRRMGPGRDGRGDGRGNGWGQGHGESWGRKARHHGHGRHREFMLARLAENPSARERLGITAEQADKIRSETDAFRKSQIRGRAELQVRGLELRELMRADNSDRAAIDKKLDEINAARLTQTKAEVHYRLDMRGMLTPEQRQKLRDMMEQRGRRGAGGGPGGPPRAPRSRAPEDENP
jgi:Spy/CpxP family protein refolding chaperone